MKTYPPLSLLVVALLSAAFLASCQSNIISSSRSKQYFPNKTGDRWTYAVLDSSGQVTDTLRVTVRQKTTLTDGTPAHLWHYATGDSSYNRYVVQQADSVLFYADSTAQHTTEKIFIPYIVSHWWNLYTNSYYIHELDTLNLMSDDKVKAFKVNVINSLQYVFPISEVLWLTPYIGMVKEKKYVYGTKTVSHVYQLLDYSVK